MNASMPLFLPVGLVMVTILAAGIYITARGDETSSNNSFREAVMWAGGFIIYAVFDYLILMH